MSLENEKYLNCTMQIAKQAGKKILEIYNSEQDRDIFIKGEDGPVTKADHASNVHICKELHKHLPSFGILTEEQLKEQEFSAEEFNALQEKTKNWRDYEDLWMIDPLDGTKDFIDGSGTFGIHIAHLNKDTPVLGVNYYPVDDVFYVGMKGKGAWKVKDGKWEQLHVSKKAKMQDLGLVGSKYRPNEKEDAILKACGLGEPLRLGPTGLKICLVASSVKDVYIVFSPKQSLWDTCSSEIILQEAGGEITYFDGTKIDYRQSSGTKILNGFLVSNGRVHTQILDKLKQVL